MGEENSRWRSTRPSTRRTRTTDLPNVRFAHGGAEAIPAEDNAFDIVILFKSLHHVPVGHMDQALGEIAPRTPPGRPGLDIGVVFAGELNEIMRLFTTSNLFAKRFAETAAGYREERFFNRAASSTTRSVDARGCPAPPTATINCPPPLLPCEVEKVAPPDAGRPFFSIRNGLTCCRNLSAPDR